MYYEHWKTYDPNGTEFISYAKLSDFVDSLEDPLRIKKPNKFKLIAMDLPVGENMEIHCMDILDALTKAFLANQNGEEEIEVVKEVVQTANRPKNYKPVTSTLEMQRKHFCARIITRHLRNYARKKRELRINQIISNKAIAYTEDTSI